MTDRTKTVADSPLVSILTPSFNQAAWLADNLQSVANQTYRRVEHIVVDGGSTDGTLEILRQVGPTVDWITEPDRGQSHALNKAFSRSRGEIVGWINSDDAFADRSAIEAVVDAFRSHPDVGVVYGHGLLLNPSNRVLSCLWAPPFWDQAFDYVTFFIQPSVFFRRSVIGSALVDESLRYVMDRDLWLRLRQRTQFKRIDHFIGVDRHQPHRKVLSEGYPVERAAYVDERGLAGNSALSRIFIKSYKIAGRFPGSVQALTVKRRIDPPISMKFDHPFTIAARQLFMRRGQMPLD